jgi:hypothetical protein
MIPPTFQVDNDTLRFDGNGKESDPATRVSKGKSGAVADVNSTR